MSLLPPDPQRRGRIARWALAAALILGTGTVIRPHETVALGPVVPVSSEEAPLPVSRLGASVVSTTVSGRGEAVVFHDLNRDLTGAAQLDVAGPDPIAGGLGATVSANGCAILRAQPSGFTGFSNAIAFRYVNRCTGEDRDIAYTNDDFSREAEMALSYDGRFAVVQVEPVFIIGFRGAAAASPSIASAADGAPAAALQQQPVALNPDRRTVFRIDTTTYAVQAMPAFPTPNFVEAYAAFGIDVSDDGGTVVAPMQEYVNGQVLQQAVVVWDVATTTSTVVSAGFGSAIYPSLSADGRFVSFASSIALVGGESGNGPWVYVHDRATGGYVRVSAPNDAAYFSSLSGDGSQVAFAVGPRNCQYSTVTPGELRATCATNRIDVAFGPTPGFTTPFQVETVSVDVNNRVAGFHATPNLSRNGRWVAWSSSAGTALVGRTVPPGVQAFARRRDAALTVDGANFGALQPGSSATASPLVRNAGRTSVILDRLEVGGAGFALVGGGTCVQGMFLTPGATCTLNVRYTASAAPGNAAGTVLAGEIGYDALVATNALTGQSVAPTPPPPGGGPTTTVATQPTPTTTSPPGRPTTTSTTTTTTVPGTIILDPQPRDVDFGPVAVGIGSAIQTITLTNVGNRPASIVTVLGGDHPDDFFVSRNDCNGIVLQPGAACTVDVLMVALAGGGRSAVLSFNVPNVGGEDVTLRGQGRFSPRLLASPAAITERGLTTIIGQGFPSDQPVTVVVGDSGLVFTVQPDALGMFRIPLAAFPSLTLGSYIVRVDARADVYELVQTALVVQLPTFQPQGPGGPAFGDSVLVTRG